MVRPAEHSKTEEDMTGITKARHKKDSGCSQPENETRSGQLGTACGAPSPIWQLRQRYARDWTANTNTERSRVAGACWPIVGQPGAGG